MEDSDWTDYPSVISLDSEDRFPNGSTTPTDEVDSSWNAENVSASDMPDRNLTDESCKQINGEVEKNSQEKPLNPKEERESCPICLSCFEDRSFLDQCFHSFCFFCILQWCEVVQTCPLCKSEFASLIHNVKSMEDYEQYVIEKKAPSSETLQQRHIEVTYDQNGFDHHGNRFRYRTTRQLRPRNSDTDHSHRTGHGTRRNNPENGTRSLVGPGLEDEARRRRHEGPRWGDEARRRRHGGPRWGDEARRRRHAQQRQRREDDRTTGIEKRRQIYAFKLRAVSTMAGERRFRNISSRFYKVNPACTHRLIPWLMRDLKVLLGNSDEEISFLIEFILSLITRIDMDSAEFIEELRPFLLQTTEHFVHELLLFSRSPFDLMAYDECVVYPWPDDNNRSHRPQTGADISEERIGQRGGTSELGAGTSLSRCEWSDTPVIPNEVHLERESSAFSRSSENIQDEPSSPLNDTAEVDARTTHLIARTNSETIAPGKHSPTISTNHVSPHQQHERYISTMVNSQSSELSTSVDGIVCDVSRSSANDIPNTESCATPTSEDRGSYRHKKHRHKHNLKRKRKHKHKHKRKHANKHKYLRSNGGSLSLADDGRPSFLSVSYCAECSPDSYITRTRKDHVTMQESIESYGVEGPKSPSVEEMRHELNELDERIQECEQKILSLSQ